jgi:hypothetical protein
MSFNCQSGLVLLTDYNDFRVTKISVSYITGENHIGSSFIRQKYFCLPTEIAVLPTEAWNRISEGACHTPPTPTPYKSNAMSVPDFVRI